MSRQWHIVMIAVFALLAGCSNTPTTSAPKPEQPYVPIPDAQWTDQADESHLLQITTLGRSTDSTLGLIGGIETLPTGDVFSHVGMFAERDIIIKVDSAGLHRFYRGIFDQDTSGTRIMRLQNGNGDTIIFK